MKSLKFKMLISEMKKRRKKKRSSSSQRNVIIQPPFTKKEYKSLRLRNGLNVLLVSDKQTTQSCAALTVKVGSADDPLKIQGLSHLLEHMVFKGSKQFPRENELKGFLGLHGGEANGCTEFEHTTFDMTVDSDSLKSALQRFSALFIEPLMDISLIQTEINTIDSEFEVYKQKDSCRLEQLMGNTAPADHPFNRFTWGNKRSLNDLDMEELKAALVDLFDRSFFGSSMNLVVVGEVSINKLEAWVVKFFSQITSKSHQESPEVNTSSIIWKSDRVYILQSVGRERELKISWMINPINKKSFLERPENILIQLLCQEGEGSLFALLKDKRWITNLNVGCGAKSSFKESNDEHGYCSTSLGQMFTLQMRITSYGRREIYKLVNYVYQFLTFVKDNNYPEHIMQEYLLTQKMKFEHMDFDSNFMDHPCEFAKRLAANMLRCPVKHALSIDYMNQEYSKEAFDKLMQYFVPDNMRIDLLVESLDGEEFETEQWFESRYLEEAIPSNFKEEWAHISAIDESFRYPPRNEFMPEDFSIRVLNNDEENEYQEDSAEIAEAEYEGQEDSIEEDDEDEEEEGEIEPSKDYAELFVDLPTKKLYYIHEISLSNTSLCVTMDVGNCVKKQMMTELFLELLKDDINPIIFKGSEAYINASLSIYEDYKVLLEFDGYHEKFNLFISRIWEKFTSFLPKFERFEIVKETMERGSHTTLLDLTVHSEKLWHEAIMGGSSADEKLKVLKMITFDEILEFIPVLRSKGLVEGICFGDLNKDEAEKISDVIVAPLESFSKDSQIHYSRLEKGVLIKNVKAKNKNESNSLARVFFQTCGEENQLHAETALVKLFHAMVEERISDQLRERENLGYDVECYPVLMLGIRGISIHVLSHTHDPEKLLASIYKSLADIKAFLEGMDEKTFMDYKNSVNSTLVDDNGISIWRQMVDGDSYQKDFNLDVKVELKYITIEDVIAFYNKYFGGSSSCRYEIRIWGCKTNPPEDCQ